MIATVKTAHEKAIGILQNNMDALHRLAHFLLEKETITGEEFMDLLHKSDRESLSLRERLFLFELRMSLSLREFRPRCDEVSRIARLFNYRPSGGLIHFPFSILNYFHRNVKISAGCSNLRSDVSFSASEHPHRARTLLMPALLAHCISYSLSPI